eukprot:3126995-Pyramimonas_sp.AAC.1
MRYETAPPPPPRRLTTTHHNPQLHTSDHDLGRPWLSITILGLLWVAIGNAVGHMQRGGDDP